MQGYRLGTEDSSPLSPEEIRRRRIEALSPGKSATGVAHPNRKTSPLEGVKASSRDNIEEGEKVRTSLAMSVQAVEPSNITQTWLQTTESYDVTPFHELMWDSTLTTDNDKARWVSQGINVREEHDVNMESSANSLTMLDKVASSHLPWGLLQQHGGPCGVLAAIQAEMLRFLLFADTHDMKEAQELDTELIRGVLSKAIATVLARAALTPPANGKEVGTKGVKLVLPKSLKPGLSWNDVEPGLTGNTPGESTSLAVFTVGVTDDEVDEVAPKRQRTNEAVADRIALLTAKVNEFLLSGPSLIECFHREGGVLLLTMSLVASRTPATIMTEFDDPNGTKLTSQFGHCSQELINLLLTGQAVSNVFDNTLTPSGDMVCRGIQHRPYIGYLSQLEALRYCEVGDYYKSPRFPIWVIGSTSHFSVMFGEASALKESQSDILLEQCRRAFKTVEGGEENGFIPKHKLGIVMSSLGINLTESQVQTLAATMEVGDAEIILWDDFWKSTSRLMTGASFDSVVHGSDDVQVFSGPPPLICAAEDSTQPQDANHIESDEEMARRLAEEWNSPGNSGMEALVEAARTSTPMETESSAMTDEDLARKLQAEWDAELSVTGNSVAATSDSPPFLEPIDDTERTVEDDGKLPARNNLPGSLAFEKYGDTFSLYHYNGLRGGTLTSFRVTRLSAEEAVGVSIALNRVGNSSSHGSGGSGDLEDVLRTKWPSCVVNWLGNTPPYID